MTSAQGTAIQQEARSEIAWAVAGKLSMDPRPLLDLGATSCGESRPTISMTGRPTSGGTSPAAQSEGGVPRWRLERSHAPCQQQLLRTCRVAVMLGLMLRQTRQSSSAGTIRDSYMGNQMTIETNDRLKRRIAAPEARLEGQS